MDPTRTTPNTDIPTDDDATSTGNITVMGGTGNTGNANAGTINT